MAPSAEKPNKTGFSRNTGSLAGVGSLSLKGQERKSSCHTIERSESPSVPDSAPTGSCPWPTRRDNKEPTGHAGGRAPRTWARSRDQIPPFLNLQNDDVLSLCEENPVIILMHYISIALFKMLKDACSLFPPRWRTCFNLFRCVFFFWGK